MAREYLKRSRESSEYFGLPTITQIDFSSGPRSQRENGSLAFPPCKGKNGFRVSRWIGGYLRLSARAPIAKRIAKPKRFLPAGVGGVAINQYPIGSGTSDIKYVEPLVR